MQQRIESIVQDIVYDDGKYQIKERTVTKEEANRIAQMFEKKGVTPAFPTQPGKEYDILLKENRELIMGNRESLEKAKQDLKEHIAGGGEEAVAKVQYKGKTVELSDPGSYYGFEGIDPELREVVLELNSIGYKTVGSCAGHPPVKTGFITFTGVSDAELQDAISVMMEYGFLGAKFDRRVSGKAKGEVVVKFPAVGKSRGGKTGTGGGDYQTVGDPIRPEARRIG